MRLTGFEKRWADAVGRCLFPKGVLGGTADELSLGQELDAFRSLSPWWTAIVIRLALWIVWFSPPFYGPRFGTFGGLSEDEREQCLERVLVARSYSVRELGMLLKMGFCHAGIGSERTLRYLGAYRLDAKEEAA